MQLQTWKWTERVVRGNDRRQSRLEMEKLLFVNRKRYKCNSKHKLFTFSKRIGLKQFSGAEKKTNLICTKMSCGVAWKLTINEQR